jgi:hypothetical protein
VPASRPSAAEAGVKFSGKYVKKRKVCVFVALVIYLAGYPVARGLHLLVHAKGYMTKDGERVLVEHSIRQGDFGVPVFTPLESLTASIASLIYSPIKPLEVSYHYFVEPKGSQWYVQVKI